MKIPRMCSPILLGILSVLAVLLPGCKNTIVPVSGKVQLNGKTLAHATVVFEPQGADPGPTAVGTTDENGRYELRQSTNNRLGAKVGEYKVSITAYAGDAEGNSSAPPSTTKVHQKILVPPKYNVRSELRFTVPSGGSSSADFNLVSEPK